MTPRAHTVVLADDVLLELEIEKTFLQRSGFKVVTATDGLPRSFATKMRGPAFTGNFA